MAGPKMSIVEVPLSEVLPTAYGTAEGELRRLASALERRAAGRIVWHWNAEHSEPPVPPRSPGIHLLLFDSTISLFDRDYDFLELTLDLAWGPGQELSVNAAVEVACWCDHDHNMHQVKWTHRTVTGPDDLVDAYAAGVAMLSGVLGTGPFDPQAWRDEAGLPGPGHRP